MKPHTILNNVFYLFVALLAVWSFANIFYNISTDESSFRFWYKFASFGWCGMLIAVAYLVLVLTDNYKKTPLIVKLAVVIYALVVYILILTDNGFVSDIYPGKYGAVERVDINKLSFYMFYAGNIAAIFAGYFMICGAVKKSKSNRFRRQAKGFLIFASIALFLLVVLFCLSNLLHFQIPAVRVFIFFVFNAGFLFLLYRYRVMLLDFHLLKHDLMNSIGDFIMIISPDNFVVKANSAFFEQIHSDNAECYRLDFSSFFENGDEILKSLTGSVADRKMVRVNQSTVKTISGDDIPVGVLMCPVFDRYSDYIGSVVFCRIRTEFYKVVAEYSFTEQEKKLAVYILQGFNNKEIGDKMGIALGTVKNYIYYLYKKTNSANRAEFLQLFS